MYNTIRILSKVSRACFYVFRYLDNRDRESFDLPSVEGKREERRFRNGTSVPGTAGVA